MDFPELNKFAVLLWKNFTLKRRQVIVLCVEILLTLLFAGTLLLARHSVNIRNVGPLHYPPISYDYLSSFLKYPDNSPGPLELAYVPSKSIVVKSIVELVLLDLNMNLKG
ncbi:PREDICTED: putative uncharacterized protein CRYM-AS1-like [Chrysochloris asiatica]|uniref:Uncharacterized protein n=1 Tax=Chrysochloris asiatica TaxID=185453 RepID=A0A9B0WZP2_CHRAS|nr:PREDICTED: putative uncharacterized protein CRYM-AS1-like [Chrysochloris asiatica]